MSKYKVGDQINIIYDYLDENNGQVIGQVKIEKIENNAYVFERKINSGTLIAEYNIDNVDKYDCLFYHKDSKIFEMEYNHWLVRNKQK